MSFSKLVSFSKLLLSKLAAICFQLADRASLVSFSKLGGPAKILLDLFLLGLPGARQRVSGGGVGGALGV